MKKSSTFLLLVIAVGFGLLMYPTLSVDYHERALVGDIIARQDKLKIEIEERLVSCPLALNCIFSSEEFLDGYQRSIGINGEIVLNIADIKTSIVLMPKFISNSVVWSCSSDKPLNVPPECRNKI